MAVRIEKKGKVWTVIHSRPEARNAMDPESADALVSAFEAFDQDADAAVAVQLKSSFKMPLCRVQRSSVGALPIHRRHLPWAEDAKR